MCKYYSYSKETSSTFLRKANRCTCIIDLFYIYTQDDVPDAIEAVEKLQLADSVDQEVQEWREIIYDLIRTIQVSSCPFLCRNCSSKD